MIKKWILVIVSGNIIIITYFFERICRKLSTKTKNFVDGLPFNIVAFFLYSSYNLKNTNERWSHETNSCK